MTTAANLINWENF